MLDVHLLRRLEKFSVPLRIDRVDAFAQRRMRGPKAGEGGGEGLGEKEMADLGRTMRVEGGTERIAADFFQRAADARGIARKLNTGGVSQKFALARNCGLDEPAKKIPDIADDHQGETDKNNNGDCAT